MSAPSAPHCASEHTTVTSPGNRLVNTQCLHEPGHPGPCRDEHGWEWTRASLVAADIRAELAQRMAAQAQEWAAEAAEAQRQASRRVP